VNAFKPVAELITPEPPDWLSEHLWQWSPTIGMSRAVEGRQPTRAEMVSLLKKVRDAAALLQGAVAKPSVCEFLNAGGTIPMDSPFKFQMIVGELQLRAERASKLPNLINDKGKTKPGRGHAQPDGAMSAKTYCALLIAEAWKYFRGAYPAPRNTQAARAADMYWHLTGGKTQSWGAYPLTAWRHQFTQAATAPAERDRGELQRHMKESARWADYLRSGTDFEGGKQSG
jgi:hypothetical protein